MLAAPSTAVTAGRVVVVDLLRGAALLGILAVNVWFFASAALAVGEPVVGQESGRVAYTVTLLLFAGKSYLLFAFLFGYSFVLQEQAASRSGRPFPAMMRRRLVGLMVLGLLHAVLLYPGDILLLYGALGFVLLRLRRLEPWPALRLGAALTAVSGAVLLILGLISWAAGASDPVAAPGASQQYAALFRGSPLEVVAANIGRYPDSLASVCFVQALPALGAMLAGLAAGRVGLFDDPARMRAVWRRLGPGAPLIGLAGAAVFAGASLWGAPGPLLAGLGVATLTAPLLSAAYAALLVRWYQRASAPALLGAVAAAGRLALTNYLAQSVAMVLLFSGIGLGLIGRVGGLRTSALVVAIFAVELLLSARWVRRWRYGPAEWILRAWTHRGQSR